MSYTKITNFAIKDTYLTGNPAKVIKGAEIDAEFNAIEANFNGIGPLGTAAATAVTTSATDTTAGRVLKVGDFGLGSSAPILADLNTGNSGFYSFDNATLNRPCDYGRVFISGGSEAAQIALNLVSGELYSRKYQSGIGWSAWVEVWTTSNLVKQSSVTDTTAGRVLINGAFGLGTLGNIPNTGNMDANLPTGFYKFVSGMDTGTPPPGANYGVVQSETYATDLSRQTYYAVSSWADNTSIFTRQIRGTNTISPWTQLITGSTGLGSFKGASLITTSITLTASDAGMLFLFFTGSTLTTTLPLYSAVPVGTNIRILNNTSLPQTIQRQGSNTINWAKDLAATTSISIPAGCFIDIATTLATDVWVVVADNVALGNGQSWTDVTASRVPGTTYTNSTGKPIEVSITGQANPGTQSITLIVSGLAVSEFADGTSTVINTMTVSAVVPIGATYSVILGSGVIFRWLELR